MSPLLEVRAVAEDEYSWLGTDFAWLTLENVASLSPSLSALTKWVVARVNQQGVKNSGDYTEFFFKLCPDLDKTIF
jgi:hypothetical protein